MNSFLRLALGLTAVGFTSIFALAANPEPAYLDFGKIAPAKDGEFVEIDLDAGLLNLAARFAEGQEKEAAQVLRGLQHVRVHVIGIDDNNRAAVLERVRDARAGLASDGWKRIATVKEKQNGADISIFARTRGEEAIEGLAITIVEGDKQAVVVNVVGDIKPEQISALGERFDIEPLKKLSVAKK